MLVVRVLYVVSGKPGEGRAVHHELKFSGKCP
jgi:hypothetical protein